MSDGLALALPNLADWVAELEQLPQVLQRHVVFGAVATGASVIRREVIARAPLHTGDVSKGHPPAGTLKRSIYQMRLRDDSTATSEVWMVAVRTGKKTRAGKGGKRIALPDAYYARWVEYGHYTSAPKSAGGTRAGRRKTVASGSALVPGAHWVMARPFFRPAFETKKDEAIKAMQDYINENLPLATATMRYIKAVA